MNGRFVLKPMGALDLDRAARLHREAFAPLGERPWTRQDIAELLASAGGGGLLLWLEDRDLGMALWRTIVDEAELLTIAVDMAYRRRGAARAMLVAVIDRALQQGARALFLEVGVDNPAARSLYAQMGFETVGRRPGYYQRPAGVADALVMRLRLNDGG
jgi:ribosomal-protein-alanine N-acetyltransferase